MGVPLFSTQKTRKSFAASTIVGLASLAFLSQEALAATRPVRPGGSTPPPTIVNPNPPQRPSQMVAGRNAGNMVLSTPLSRSAAARTITPVTGVTKVSTDP